MAKKTSRKPGCAARHSEPPPLPTGYRGTDDTAMLLSTAVLTPSPAQEPGEALEPEHLLTPLAAAWPDLGTLQGNPSVKEVPPAPIPGIAAVEFALFEPVANRVSVCGDFNGWLTDATPMRRGNDGVWRASVALPPGRYEYKFRVDEQWIPDPTAQSNVWNTHGTLNSILEVPEQKG